jgi:hypothetical protein
MRQRCLRLGISPRTVRYRMKTYNITFDEAASLNFKVSRDPASIKHQCRLLGLKYSTIHSRIRRGFTFEEAVSFPVRPQGPRPDSLKTKCREAGVSYQAVLDRMRRNRRLTVAEAIARSAVDRGVFVRACAAHGVHPRTVRSRMKRHPDASLTDALSPLPRRSPVYKKPRTFSTSKSARTMRRHSNEGAAILSQFEAEGWGLAIPGRTLAERCKNARRVARYLRDPVSQQPILPNLPNTGGRIIDPNSLQQRALAAGLNPYTVRARVWHGWTEEEALSTPLLKKGSSRNPHSITQQAIAAGLKPATVWKRLSRYAWSAERALSTPVSR